MEEKQGGRCVKELATAPTVQMQRAVDAGAQLAFLSIQASEWIRYSLSETSLETHTHRHTQKFFDSQD